jgi:hypothetical protein
MRLKRWESPRRQGRNDKGKGGSARQRQLKKQFKMLSKKLKGGESNISPLFCPQQSPLKNLPLGNSQSPETVGDLSHFQIREKNEAYTCRHDDDSSFNRHQ